MTAGLQTPPPAVAPRAGSRPPTPVDRMRALTPAALGRMYLPAQRRYVFTLRRRGKQVVPEGVSRRYSAIVAIGLAGETAETVDTALCGDGCEDLVRSLLDEAPRVDNLGDVALTIWAAHLNGLPVVDAVLKRLETLFEADASPPTVEVAWAVTALSHSDEGHERTLRQRFHEALLSAFEPASALFRHRVGAGGGLRSHVSCFADLVYPIQALAFHHRATGQQRSLDTAEGCASRACSLLGPAGQWWWHYDVRTGRIIEGYPVYAVHQDAMAPMMLLDLADCGGTDRSGAVSRGLAWLATAPELNGRSLVDESAGLIWRKVARHEPNKLARQLGALASRLHPRLRVPGLSVLMPPGRIDFECRPYELGWLLYAFSPARKAAWSAEGQSA